MELKEFVKGVLTQITDAVKESQEEIKNGAVIVPNEEIEGEIRTKSSRRFVTKINFNVELETTSQDQKESGLFVLTSIIGGKHNSKDSIKEGKSTRIEFSIPVVLPVSEK